MTRFCLISVFVLALMGPSPARAENVFEPGGALLVSVPMDTGSVVNGGYPIDQNGYAEFPVIGRLYVADKDIAFLQDTLSKGWAQYLRDVNVRVRPAYRLALLGHWQRPGMHYVDADATVWEACLPAGGPAGEVNLMDWKVLRGSEDLSIAILDAFSRGLTLRNAGVKSGDIFTIPVPDPASGPWYWFRESLGVTAQIAAITSTILTSYITYIIITDRD